MLTIVRNRTAHFVNLVEGLRRSSLQPTELVVVDMSDEPIAAPSTTFPVKILRLPTTGLPLAMARNRAAGAATSKRLLFLDVDCIPLRECLATLNAALDSNDALLCADVRYLGPGDAGNDWTDVELLQAGRSHPARPFPTNGVRRERNAGLFWSLTFAMHRARFASLGGFDERFSGYGAEDTDFGFRADAAGVPLLFVGGAIACHQHHPVYNPPLQHFNDIIRNAQLFKTIWSVWPMEGWLEAFQAIGLIAFEDDRLIVLRSPDPAEIVKAQVVQNTLLPIANPLPSKLQSCGVVSAIASTG
ncbi:glycosyltransferase family 2 protein [Sphingomonas radiodurans]|uniref:glycosyltransferase family 2 protein n=1 Tax=Sphingomonas radiodurans TaxID=2890321 RepID=UPI001E5446D0|nr:glycosyltransferase [Sphingomonas radiodurans]WBH15833.1 glycosyltransferase [Sphingomonas radiodurans]